MAKAKEMKLPAKRKAMEVGKSDERWKTDGMGPESAAEAEQLKARIHERPKRPSVSFIREGEKRLLHVGTHGDSASSILNSIRAYDVSGSGHNQFVGNILDELARIIPLPDDDETAACRVGAALAMIGGIAPENELEGTMALQMVAANEAALSAFKRSKSAEYLEQATAFGNLGIKAMRAFALHAETLSKLRRNGEQVVKHVHVNEGGQAVIANTVTTGGGGK